MQRCVSILIFLVQQDARLGKQILHNLLAATVGSPMERRAALGILGIEVKLLLMEMQDGIDFVALGSDVQQSHAEVAANVEIGLILLKRLEDGDISLEGRIVCSSISFIIFGVEQLASVALDFRQGVAFVLEISAIVFDVEVDMFVLVQECAVMDDRILLAVANGHQV